MSGRSSRSEAEPLIEARGLGVRRGRRWVLRDIDLAVRPGEIVTLIGPNGGGKTTTLRALLGIVPAGAGSTHRRPGLKVGYVPQKLTVDWTLPLSVRRLMRLTANHPADEIATALGETGVEHLLDQPVQGLSGGEFQRVLIARALLGRPELLVLDEPVQGVDFAGEVALYELIGAIRERLGCGVLLVSHDLHLVMARTDRVICINTHVCCAGAPREVALDPAYASLFGPRAAEVVALYRHRHDHTHDDVRPPADAAEER